MKAATARFSGSLVAAPLALLLGCAAAPRSGAPAPAPPAASAAATESTPPPSAAEVAAAAWRAWDQGRPGEAARLTGQLPDGSWDRLLLEPLTGGLLCPLPARSAPSPESCRQVRGTAPLVVEARSRWMAKAAEEAPPPTLAPRLLELLLYLDFDPLPTEERWGRAALTRWDEHRQAWAPRDWDLWMLASNLRQLWLPGDFSPAGEAQAPAEDAPRTLLGRSLEQWAAAWNFERPRGDEESPGEGGSAGAEGARGLAALDDVAAPSLGAPAPGFRFSARREELRTRLLALDAGQTPPAAAAAPGEVDELLFEAELLAAEARRAGALGAAAAGRFQALFRSLESDAWAAAPWLGLRVALQLALLEAPTERRGARQRLQAALERSAGAVPIWCAELQQVAQLYAARLASPRGKRWTGAEAAELRHGHGLRAVGLPAPLPLVLLEGSSEPLRELRGGRVTGGSMSWLNTSGPVLPAQLAESPVTPIFPGGAVLLPLVEPELGFATRLYVEPRPRWVLLPLNELLDGTRRAPR